VNCTGVLKNSYLKLLPGLCLAGDDGQYGSSVEHDVHVLQAVSRRIHYGSFYVAESKYRANREAFDRLVSENDEPGIMALLTRADVEKKIIGRLRDKVSGMQAGANRDIRTILDPGIVSKFYEECIIPLTKKGEVLYLLNRKAGIR
jgi:chorismate mutase